MWVFIVVACTVHAFLAQLGDKICFGQVCRLPTESPYSPTPLLKLIHVWCKNARSESASLLCLFHSLHNVYQNIFSRYYWQSELQTIKIYYLYFFFTCVVQVLPPLGQTEAEPAGV